MADTKLTTPGPLETAIFQVGNGALLGYLPEVTEFFGNEGDAERLRQGMALGDAANPRASALGFAGGLALPGGLAVKTVKRVAPFVKPAVTAALGLAGNAGKSTIAKTIASKVGALAGAASAGGVGYGLFGGQSAQAPAPVAEAPAAGTKNTQRAQPDWYDQMAGIAGVDRDTIKEMVRQDGGVRLGTLQALNGMKSRAPSYRDLAMAYVMDSFEQEGLAAEASGDQQRKDELAAQFKKTMADILGADPMTFQPQAYE